MATWKQWRPKLWKRFLQKLYMKVRKQDGSEYEPDSLKVMQAGLERNVSTQQNPYRIINSREFASSKGSVGCESQRTENERLRQKTNRAQSFNSAQDE